MINHYTLDYHVNNFNTFSRWLWRKNQNSNPLLCHSDPYPYTNQNHYPNHNPNPNEKLDLLHYMVMSRDITWPKQFFARNLSGKHFNPTSCAVIRNQRSKIRRSNIISTAWTLLEKSRNSSVEWFIVYKISYRRARAWPSGCARASKGILHTRLYTIYPIVARALGLAAVHPLGRVCARAKVVCKISLLARRTRPKGWCYVLPNLATIGIKSSPKNTVF